MNAKTTLRTVALLAAVLLLAGAASSVGAGDGDHRDRRATLTGTWFLSVGASGLTSFYSFHRDRTVSSVVSNVFGGAPRPGTPKSMDHGVWGRVGHQLEAAVYRFNYDLDTGEAVTITRIRLVIDLDRRSENGSGEFFVTQWSCPAGGLDCPDPNRTDPSPPGEFAPPGNSFTMTRVGLR